VALLEQELRHQELLEGVASFSSSALRHTTTLERTVLPDTQALQQEKSHTEFIQVGISTSIHCEKGAYKTLFLRIYSYNILYYTENSKT
jgi:hypothetical protein